MTPITALKYIAKVKKHISTLELSLAYPGLMESIDNEQAVKDLEQLKKLLKQYEDVLKEWEVI